MLMNRERLLTVREIAKDLNVSQRHVINLTNRRMIPCLRLGRAIRYDSDAVQRALKKLEVKEH